MKRCLSKEAFEAYRLMAKQQVEADNLKANYLVKPEPIEQHNCSYSSSTLIGGPASCATFRCNVCGEEWEKDVS